MLRTALSVMVNVDPVEALGWLARTVSKCHADAWHHDQCGGHEAMLRSTLQMVSCALCFYCLRSQCGHVEESLQEGLAVLEAYHEIACRQLQTLSQPYKGLFATKVSLASTAGQLALWLCGWADSPVNSETVLQLCLLVSANFTIRQDIH